MTLPSEERPDRDLPPRPPTPADALPPPPPISSHGVAEDSRSLPVNTDEPPAVLGEPAAPAEPAAPGRPARQPFTRIRAAWAGVWAGLVAVILLIVFIGQNTAPIHVQFLWLDGQIPTALALLMAGVGGAIIALAVAAARILQLRRMMRRNIR